MSLKRGVTGLRRDGKGESRLVAMCLKRERGDRVKERLKGRVDHERGKSERPGGRWCVLRERVATGLREKESITRDGKSEQPGGEWRVLREREVTGLRWKSERPGGSGVS